MVFAFTAKKMGVGGRGNSSVFEKLYYTQISNHMERYFSKFLCAFRRGLSTQYCLLYMIEKINKAFDNSEHCGLLLTDLSKAFDCVKYGRLIEKMHAYNFDLNDLTLIYSYLSDRKQRTKKKDGSYRIHHINLQRLATEIYKFKHNLGPEILNTIIEPKLSSYNTRSDNIVRTRAVKSVYNGAETISFRAQKTWKVISLMILKMLLL